MKNLLLLLMIGLLLTACEKETGSSPASEQGRESAGKEVASLLRQEDHAGFRGIAWGTPLSELSDMVPVAVPAGGDGEKDRFYLRRGDRLELGDLKLEKIEYRFDDGAFSRALLTLDGGVEEGRRLKEDLFAAYGAVGPFISPSPRPGDAVVPYKTYVWIFRSGSLVLLLNEEGGPSQLVLSSDPEARFAVGS